MRLHYGSTRSFAGFLNQTTKRSCRSTAIALSLAAVTCCSSYAQLVTFDFPQPAIPDGDPVGISATSFSDAIASVDNVNITICHEWLGDLTVKLISPAGPEFVLFERVGVTSESPDGSSTVLGTFTSQPDSTFVLEPTSYRFGPTGAPLDPLTQQTLSSMTLLSSGDVFAAQSWPTGPFPAGTWRLSVSDSSVLGSGAIMGASLEFTAVPEPAHGALASGVALVAMAAWRFQRRSGTFGGRRAASIL